MRNVRNTIRYRPIDVVGSVANWQCVHYLHALHSVAFTINSAAFGMQPHPRTHSSKTNRVQFDRHMVALVSLSFYWWAYAKCEMSAYRPNAFLQFITAIIGISHCIIYVSQTNIIKIKPSQQFVQIHRSFSDDTITARNARFNSSVASIGSS